jgi:hypothetical protein
LLTFAISTPAEAAGTCQVTWRLTNNPGSIGTLNWSTS